jgi:anti-anti-sigma factor
MAAAPPDDFSVDVTVSGARTVVVARGELDLATAPFVEQAVRAPAGAGGHLVLDLRGLSFMDSSGVRVLITTHGAVEAAGGRLSLVIGDEDGPVGQVLRISGLLPEFERLEDPDV